MVEWNQREYLAHIAGKVAQNLERACEFAADEARAEAPRLTGRLVRGVDIKVVVEARGMTITGWVGVVRKVFWAWFQEMGTSKMAAHPFLRPAVFGNAEKIVRMVEGKD